MLPYSEYSNIVLRYDEFNQELGLNRIADKLLANDEYIDSIISSLSNGNISDLRIASRDEVKALTVSNKVISPATLLSLSATETDAYVDSSSNRFITDQVYKGYIGSKQPATMFADLTWQGSFIGSVFPSNELILSAAVDYISSYDAPDGTLFYVRYIYTNHWRTKHKRSTLGGHYYRNHYLDSQYQDTYRRVDGEWSLVRRRQSNRI